MDNDIYAIVDIDGYASEMREAAAKSFADPFDDDLDSYISINQMINLVKEECIGFDDNNRPLLNEDANEKIYESTIIWIHEVGLAKLAAKGFVECAWDDSKNEFVFWKNETQTKKKTNDKRRNSKKNKGS